MPIRIQNDLPAKAILERENIFVMDENRAMSQDIRPLEILTASARALQHAAAGELYISDDQFP